MAKLSVLAHKYNKASNTRCWENLTGMSPDQESDSVNLVVFALATGRGLT